MMRRSGSRTALALLACVGIASAQELMLASPLSTVVRAAPAHQARFSHGATIAATIVVPPQAAGQLGIGAWVTDQHGRWHQVLRPGTLSAGSNRVTFTIGGDELLTGDRTAWEPSLLPRVAKGGLVLWQEQGSAPISIQLTGLSMQPLTAVTDAHQHLTEVEWPSTMTTGARWELTCRPQEFPANPYDPQEFALDLEVRQPDGSVALIPGFALLPMKAQDGGDREIVEPAGRERFCVRFRPRQAGEHHLRLLARWRSGTPVAHELPPLTAIGTTVDPYVRIDRNDPRFFAVDGRFFWGVGGNLRAVSDPRCAHYLGTRLTPNLGTRSYDAYLARLAAAGGTAAEIWLSSWNLGLEWRADWPEQQGLGRYSQERAWRLDRILDLAWQRGIRLQLTISNHGQISEQVDREWHDNPYNGALGGPNPHALTWFSDTHSLAYQQRYRRYLVARYADHPALLGWKLLSEQNLTAAGMQPDLLARWHTEASTRWRELDAYDHPITTHWSGNWHVVSGEVASLPSLDYLTIDAYHGQEKTGGMLLSTLLQGGTGRRGLSRFGKPVWIAEYGGNWDACPQPQLAAEHAAGGFLALVTGYAGSPLLWWFEWVDQGDRWAPYRAVAAFISGEDPRGADAQSLGLVIEERQQPNNRLWCRAWARAGRMLGYLVDEDWLSDGAVSAPRDQVSITVGDQIAAGALRWEWWNADTGLIIRTDRIVHPGGRLSSIAPAWQRHLAFKLIRE